MITLLRAYRAEFGTRRLTAECIVIPMAFLVVFLVMGVC